MRGTIQNEYAAMYLDQAAQYRTAADLGLQMHRQALRAKRKNAAKELALWNLHWAARTQHERMVSNIRAEGALLHYGIPKAETLAHQVAERYSQERTNRRNQAAA